MKKCEVCELCDSKYRCPSCRVLYCSVGCYKTHKDRCKELRLFQQNKLPTYDIKEKLNNDSESGELTDTDSENDDKLRKEQLSCLENSKSIKDMLENKHLREVIKKIDEKNDPAKELDSATRLLMFVQFAEECLNIVKGGDTG